MYLPACVSTDKLWWNFLLPNMWPTEHMLSWNGSKPCRGFPKIALESLQWQIWDNISRAGILPEQKDTCAPFPTCDPCTELWYTCRSVVGTLQLMWTCAVGMFFFPDTVAADTLKQPYMLQFPRKIHYLPVSLARGLISQEKTLHPCSCHIFKQNCSFWTGLCNANVSVA